jgi:hypothetical protein
MKPLVITSKKAQTRATTINAIQPSSSEEESLEPDFALEALETVVYALGFAKYDDLAIRAKTTTSTGLAAQTASKQLSTHIPAQFNGIPRSLMRKPHIDYHRTNPGIMPLN